MPLRLQAGYTPDGWLGALSGSKLVHDISQADLDAASERQAFLDLVRDLGNRGKDGPSGKGAVGRMGLWVKEL